MDDLKVEAILSALAAYHYRRGIGTVLALTAEWGMAFNTGIGVEPVVIAFLITIVLVTLTETQASSQANSTRPGVTRSHASFASIKRNGDDESPSAPAHWS